MVGNGEAIGILVLDRSFHGSRRRNRDESSFHGSFHESSTKVASFLKVAPMEALMKTAFTEASVEASADDLRSTMRNRYAKQTQIEPSIP